MVSRRATKRITCALLVIAAIGILVVPPIGATSTVTISAPCNSPDASKGCLAAFPSGVEAYSHDESVQCSPMFWSNPRGLPTYNMVAGATSSFTNPCPPQNAIRLVAASLMFVSWLLIDWRWRRRRRSSLVAGVPPRDVSEVTAG